MVSCEVIEKDFEGDIRIWTVSGMRQFDMYRLISDRVKPLQLGEPGRQKVGESRDVFSTLWSTLRRGASGHFRDACQVPGGR